MTSSKWCANSSLVAPIPVVGAHIGRIPLHLGGDPLCPQRLLVQVGILNNAGGLSRSGDLLAVRLWAKLAGDLAPCDVLVDLVGVWGARGISLLQVLVDGVLHVSLNCKGGFLSVSG